MLKASVAASVHKFRQRFGVGNLIMTLVPGDLRSSSGRIARYPRRRQAGGDAGAWAVERQVGCLADDRASKRAWGPTPNGQALRRVPVQRRPQADRRRELAQAPTAWA